MAMAVAMPMIVIMVIVVIVVVVIGRHESGIDPFAPPGSSPYGRVEISLIYSIFAVTQAERSESRAGRAGS